MEIKSREAAGYSEYILFTSTRYNRMSLEALHEGAFKSTCRQLFIVSSYQNQGITEYVMVNEKNINRG